MIAHRRGLAGRAAWSIFVILGGCGSSTMRGVLGAGENGAQLDELLPISGADVCLQVPEADCVQTDDDGSYSLPGIPADGDVAVLFSKSGFSPQLYLRRGNILDVTYDTFLANDADNTEVFGRQMPIPGKGLIVINDATHKDGTFASLPDQTDVPAVYSKDGLDLEVEDTGTVGDGIIYFVGVEPGEVTLELSPADGLTTCEQDRGAWVGPRPNTIAVPVADGVETWLVIRCR
jgi:hypothetical protein